MAYSTYSDIQSEFRDLELSSSTKITQAEVTEFISQADQYIDSKLSKKYITPITAINSLPIVKQISIWLTAGRVWNILNEVTEGVKDRGKSLIDKAEKMLKDILSNENDEIILSGSSIVSTSLIDASNYNNGITPLFDKDIEQW